MGKGGVAGRMAGFWGVPLSVVIISSILALAAADFIHDLPPEVSAVMCKSKDYTCSVTVCGGDVC